MISPASNAKKLGIFQAPRHSRRAMISPASNTKKLQRFQAPHCGRRAKISPASNAKNYLYFDRSFLKVLNMVGEQFPLLRMWKNYEFLIVASGRSSTWSVNDNIPSFKCEKTTNISILNMVGGQQLPPASNDKKLPIFQAPHHGRRATISPASNAKNYEYFKLLIVVGEQQFPQLQTLKNYEYFDRSFLKVLNMVGEQFLLLRILKNY